MMDHICGESGQMAVELAALAPVMIVVSLIVFNLSRFCMLCAMFDRVSLDAVVAHGISPSGQDAQITGVHDIQQCIEQALPAKGSCEVAVSAEEVSGEGAGRLSVMPALVRYRCRLSYAPWPSSFSIAGVSVNAPLVLWHERSLVVDRYKPGVVM
ncbi:MAG: hypothetical protein Q4A01_04710 [Coriobacteriales bacterium]|nr:hypothetical protein [Coriobacteriales bacterium]